MQIQERVTIEISKLQRASVLMPNDGLLLMLIKKACRPYLFWHSKILTRFLALLEPFAKQFMPDASSSTADDGCLFRLCVDIYLGIVFAVLLSAYTAAVALARGPFTVPGACSFGGVLLICLLRGYEIVAFLSLLHSQPRYRSSSLIRSLVNTIWHYVEMMIIFGVCYLACSYFIGDRFAPESNPSTILTHYVNAAYFSFISLATIGFGDLSPQTGIGKMLVMSEGMVGLFLLVIVLQRAMSAGQELSIDDVCGQLDERCATFMSLMRAAQPSFPRPPHLVGLSKDDISHCLSRLAALGVLRFDINLGAGMYAYHWTDMGKQIISRMP